MKPPWNLLPVVLILAATACDRTRDEVPGVWLAADDPQNDSRKTEFFKDGRFVGGEYEGRWSVPKRGRVRAEVGNPGTRQPILGVISGDEMSLTWIDVTARFVRQGSAKAAKLQTPAPSR